MGLKGLDGSVKSLTFGIEWLIVEKFVSDEQTRNILCDSLGDRMSLIHEYARNKEVKAENNLIRNLLRAGYSPQKIAKDTKMPLSRVRAIERTLKSE